MRNLKKFLAVLVVVAMIASSMMTAFAAADPTLTAADKAAGLGLLQGGKDGVTDEYLALSTQRIQTAIIYLRLLGKEDEARAYTETTENFADANQVTGDNVNILAYLKANPSLGWVGDGTNFNPLGPVTGKALYKVMLTSLGYQQGLDFDYDDTIGFARAKNFAMAAYAGTLDEVTNNVMATAMMEALNLPMYGKTTTLAQKLVDDKIITAEDASLYTSYVAPVATPTPTPAALDFTVANVEKADLMEYVVTFNNAVASSLLVKGNFQVNGADAVCAVAAADGKSVTLTAAVGKNTTQQGDASITVKKAVGLAADTTKKVTAVADTTLPTVKSVSIKGNRVVTVVFSEPVTGADYLGNYTIDGVIYPAGTPTNPSGDLKTWTFTTTGPIATTAKAFVVNTAAVKDYANLPLAINSTAIAVATDTVAPKEVKLVSATQTSVVVTFDKDMSTVGTVTATGGAVFDSAAVDSADAKKWTLTFKTDNPIPAYGGTITFANATDVFGNVAATLTLATGTPTVDLTRPGFVSAVPGDNQKTLVITYDKDVLLDGTYTVKDTAPVTYSVSVAYKDSAASKKVLLLTSTTDFNTSKSPLTLTISGVSDTTALKNKVIDVNTTVVAVDKIAPLTCTTTYDNAGHKIYVKFNEAIDATTAVVGNFYYTQGGIVKPMSGIATATGMVGTDTVVFTVADTTTLDGTVLAAVNVAAGIKDLAGNASAAMTSAPPAAVNTTTIALSSAKVTGANSVALAFASAIDLSKVSLTDYVIMAGSTVVTPINKALSSDGLTLTLTTNYSFTTDGKINGSAVTIATNTSFTTANSYGIKIVAIPTTTLTDGFAPAASALNAAYVVDTTDSSNVVIRVKVSEPVVVAPATGEYTVTLDGANVNANVTPTVEVDSNGVGYIKFTVTCTANMLNKSYSVTFTPVANTLVVDAGSNKLGGFTYSGTISVKPN